MHVTCIYVRAWWGREGEKLKNHCFVRAFVKGQSGHEGAKESLQRREPSTFFRHFGATFGPLWASSGAFGSLDDYFGIIVELLWM